jgi:hypothetical protein
VETEVENFKVVDGVSIERKHMDVTEAEIKLYPTPTATSFPVLIMTDKKLMEFAKFTLTSNRGRNIPDFTRAWLESEGVA